MPHGSVVGAGLGIEDGAAVNGIEGVGAVVNSLQAPGVASSSASISVGVVIYPVLHRLVRRSQPQKKDMVPTVTGPSQLAEHVWWRHGSTSVTVGAAVGAGVGACDDGAAVGAAVRWRHAPGTVSRSDSSSSSVEVNPFLHWSVSLSQPQKKVLPDGAKMEPSQSAEHVIDPHGSMVGVGVVGVIVGAGLGAAVVGAAVTGAVVVGATVDGADVVVAVVTARRLFTCTTSADEATLASQDTFPAGARKTPTV